jgi:hypothetical protein
MTSATECYPLHTCEVPSTSWARRLLARLSGLSRQRPSSLNPEELPPHLLRDLGLADQGFRHEPDARPMGWPSR